MTGQDIGKLRRRIGARYPHICRAGFQEGGLVIADNEPVFLAFRAKETWMLIEGVGWESLVKEQFVSDTQEE